jgi:hypothetical protein
MKKVVIRAGLELDRKGNPNGFNGIFGDKAE